MEPKKLKLLALGKKGILLSTCPKDIEDLYEIIHTYLKETAENYIISFKDQDGDECEILGQETFEAATQEFSSKITLKLVRKTQINPVLGVSQKSIESRKLLKYFKKKSRSMTFFDLETYEVEEHKLAKGISFKEYAAWIDLPSGEIFYCGGGHPVSSDEVFLINPYTNKYKKLPNMIFPRHSHAIVYKSGYVYIFGGIENVYYYGAITKKSERFNLSESFWEEIPDIDVPRGDAAATVYEENIYILGKGSTNLFQYNTNKPLIDLEEDNGGCMSINENLLYCFHASFLKIYDLLSLKRVERIQLPGNKSW